MKLKPKHNANNEAIKQAVAKHKEMLEKQERLRKLNPLNF